MLLFHFCLGCIPSMAHALVFGKSIGHGNPFVFLLRESIVWLASHGPLLLLHLPPWIQIAQEVPQPLYILLRVINKILKGVGFRILLFGACQTKLIHQDSLVNDQHRMGVEAFGKINKSVIGG